MAVEGPAQSSFVDRIVRIVRLTRGAPAQEDGIAALLHEQRRPVGAIGDAAGSDRTGPEIGPCGSPGRGPPRAALLEGTLGRMIENARPPVDGHILCQVIGDLVQGGASRSS